MVLALAMCEFSTKRSGWLTGRLPRRGAVCGSEGGGSSRSSQPPLNWFARAAGCGAAKLADEQLLVAVRGQEILGGATFSLVCNGRGLWCSQIGSLHRSGGGAAMVAALFHRARDLEFRFLATSPLDKSAEGFWRAAGLGSNTARFHPTELAGLQGLESPFAPHLRAVWLV